MQTEVARCLASLPDDSGVLDGVYQLKSYTFYRGEEQLTTEPALVVMLPPSGAERVVRSLKGKQPPQMLQLSSGVYALVEVKSPEVRKTVFPVEVTELFLPGTVMESF